MYAMLGASVRMHLGAGMENPEPPADFTWAVHGAGVLTGTQWDWTPPGLGTVPLAVQRIESNGLGITEVRVVPAHTGTGATIAVIGDSLTAFGYYIDDLSRLLPNATWVGTLDTSPLGFWHDGWSGSSAVGWTTSEASPLVTSGVLDAAAYIAALGATPNVVVIQLGINSVINASEGSWEAVVAAEIAAIDLMITALLAAGVTAIVPVYTSPGSSNQEIWSAQYDPNDWADRKRWKARHWAQMQAQMAAWADQPQLFPAAVATAIDPVAGYQDGILRPDNAVHPVLIGYDDIAESIRAAVCAALE